MLGIVESAFKIPRWIDTYRNYQAMPSLPLRLLAPLPFGHKYADTVFELKSAFTLLETEKSPIDNSPVYNMDIYNAKVEINRELSDLIIRTFIQISGGIIFLWCFFVFFHFKLALGKGVSNNVDAFHITAWTSTKHYCVLLAVITTVCTLALLF